MLIEAKPETAVCTLCAATESTGFYTGCMIKDGNCKDSGWDCDGKGQLTRCTTSSKEASEPNNYHDAYRGARDDLQIWKKRALEAEESCRRLTQALNEENGPMRFGEPVLCKEASEAAQEPFTREQIEHKKTALKALATLAAFANEANDDNLSNAMKDEIRFAVEAVDALSQCAAQPAPEAGKAGGAA